MSANTAKTRRISLRASARQADLLRRAADVSATSMSEFVLGSALSHAKRVFADGWWFVASNAEYQAFLELLDAPASTDKLAALSAREPMFDKPFTLD